MATTAVILLAAALGMDAFSMSVGLGLAGGNQRQIFVVSGLVTVFHVLLPLGGWLLGIITGNAVGRYASLFGAFVLIVIGMMGLWPSDSENSLSKMGLSMGGLGLVILAGSVSLDALSVGFSLGTLGGSLWFTVILFGVTAGLMTAGGFLVGQNVGGHLGDKAELVGSLILILIGVKMLFS